MRSPLPSAPSPRERILVAASELFYRKGIPNVGINEIIATSDVARMTLYHHFASKDELVLASLTRRSERRRSDIVAAIAGARTHRSKILAVFDYLKRVVADSGFRGCVFVNAAAECPDPIDGVRRLAAEHKAWIAAQFESVARAAGWRHPGLLAEQLMVLYDGAIVGAYLKRSAQPVVAAAAAAKVLLAAAAKQ